MADPATLVLNYRIAPEYYMYRERFGLSASPAQAVTLGEAAYPQGKVKYDPTFDKDMEVFTVPWRCACRCRRATGSRSP